MRKKDNLVNYTYYDEQGNHIAILDKNYLCTELKVDKVLLEEPNDRIMQIPKHEINWNKEK